MGPGRPSALRWVPVVVGAARRVFCWCWWIVGDPIAKRDLGVQLCGGVAGAGTWGRVTSGTFERSGAPGANARSVVNGAVDGDGSVRTRSAENVRDPSRVLEQGPDRQRTPGLCSGGVSSITGASESRAPTISAAGSADKGSRSARHRS